MSVTGIGVLSPWRAPCPPRHSLPYAAVTLPPRCPRSRMPGATGIIITSADVASPPRRGAGSPAASTHDTRAVGRDVRVTGDPEAPGVCRAVAARTAHPHAGSHCDIGSTHGLALG